jgi:hypothetical protein
MDCRKIERNGLPVAINSTEDGLQLLNDLRF